MKRANKRKQWVITNVSFFYYILGTNSKFQTDVIFYIIYIISNIKKYDKKKILTTDVEISTVVGGNRRRKNIVAVVRCCEMQTVTRQIDST